MLAKPYSIPYPHLRMVGRIREESANDREYAACKKIKKKGRDKPDLLRKCLNNHGRYIRRQ
jgi:hypothetical protein